MKTYSLKKEEVDRNWFVIDATDKILGLGHSLPRSLWPLNSVGFKLRQLGSNGYGLERPKGSQGNWELTIIISKSHNSQCES